MSISRDALIFDELEISNISFGQIGTKNTNNSFQIVTPFRRLVLAAESKTEMDEWIAALKAANSKDYFEGGEHEDFLSGHHHWYATFHARPTYCNLCREPLSGVTSHGLSCEICKCKVHKRCAVKALPNCKWTTLASIGQEIIEDQFGNVIMPHQWMEGNLPVSSKCSVCDKTCGSVLRLQDWRCLWCRAFVHTACRPQHPVKCPLGLAKVSVVPPTALNSIGNDEAWEAVRPQGCSPLLVFVNSKSGENQGIKFLRRFKQLLNPAQVFDLIHGGPGLGLRLFRHFDPFRILVCSGDGSVGWVLSEIDRLNMHKQCQIGVLPLGTGNDLARVLGWGASCDDDTHLPQLLDKYEKASTKMLDRWSIMTLERGMILPSKISLDESLLSLTMAEYEDNVLSHLAKIIQSNQHAEIISSAKILCETIRDFTLRLAHTTLTQGDELFSEKCQTLNHKLDMLVQTLEDESEAAKICKVIETTEKGKVSREKQEKDIINFREKSCAMGIEREALLSRANSLKKAVRQLVEYMESVVEQHSAQGITKTEAVCKFQPSTKNELEVPAIGKNIDRIKDMCRLKYGIYEHTPCSSPRYDEGQNTFLLPSPIPSCQSSRSPSAADIRISALSPLPDVRRGSGSEEVFTLPVPEEFADNLIRKKSLNLEEDQENTPTLSQKQSLETVPCNIGIKIFKGDVAPDGDILKFEKDILWEFEKSDGTNLWENVVSSLNESTRTLITKTGGNSSDVDANAEDGSLKIITDAPSTEGENIIEVDYDAKDSQKEVQVDEQQDISSSFIEKGNDDLAKIFNKRIDEMDLSHIDSSESPSEETSPPNQSASPPLGQNLQEPPRAIHKSLTEGFLKAKVGINFSRSLTELNGDYLKVDASFYGDDKATMRRHSDIKTTKDLTNAMNVGRKNSMEDNRLYRKDSRRLYLENDIDITDNIELESEFRCSLAHFVEGSDIARMSFKKKPRRKEDMKMDDDGDLVKIQFKGSNGDLTKEWNEKFNEGNKSEHRSSVAYSETDDEDIMDQEFEGKQTSVNVVPQFHFIIDPPSPVHSDDTKRMNEVRSGKLSEFTLASPGLLEASPQATRRVSNCSLMKAEIMEFVESRNRSKSVDKSDADVVKKLPIINPLVRLPMWPNVSGGAGLISQVLLANADALCATAAPLMDFDETLLQGFYEKCVMNNYFGIGIDAKIALDFHHKREEHPEKCRSRAKNYMWYGVLGSREWLQKTYKNLEQRVQLECDGQRIPLPSLQGIVVLNIPSFMGGTNFWGGKEEDDCFLAPSFDDKILEVVAVFGSVQMAASRLINLQHHRIAQCQMVQINVLGDEGVPIQVDGEAWIQPPGVIRIIHKNRMQMLCRNRTLENCLKSWEEKQKQSQQVQTQQLTLESQTITTNSQSSSSGVETIFPPLLTDEESRLLIGFIEVTTTLVKCVQLVTISHSTLDRELYDLAAKTTTSLENVHPGGKILEGHQLRPKVTDLVNSAKDLYEEACCVLRDKGTCLKLREDMEGKLNTALADMEIELRKCSIDENGLVGLHHIFEQSGANRGRGRGLFWLKLKRHGNQRQREVASWGVAEVSQWLESLQLPEYIESFAKNDIRGKELIALARRDLKDLGVTKVGHVKRILQAIRDLNT
ncbi:hypothetical protein RUM43_001122 [Polyplax serrata]|uniref:Diacylglycerol kinase n=1 Tax=Polyplax serrata TaxID=468196 RepID=A0AAN8SEE2_POLSC